MFITRQQRVKEKKNDETSTRFTVGAYRLRWQYHATCFVILPLLLDGEVHICLDKNAADISRTNESETYKIVSSTTLHLNSNIEHELNI